LKNRSTRRKHSFLHRMKIGYYRHISDRRRYLRKPIRVKVTEKVSGLFEHFASTNISAGGMFLKSDRPFAIGANLKIEFLLPGDEDPVQADAQVVRTTPPGNFHDYCAGMGIVFTAIEEEDRKRIEEFIKRSGLS